MATSARSKSTSASTKRRRIDRPFDLEVLARAVAVADRYQLVLWFEDDDWFGRGSRCPASWPRARLPTSA